MADISKILLPSEDEYNVKDSVARSGLANKQDTLVSGTNIKTINNTSLLGSGNIDIQGGGGETYRINGTYDPTAQPSGDYVIDGSVYPAEDVYDAVQDEMNLVLSLDGSIYTEYNVGYLSVDNNPTQMIVQFMKSANHGYASYTIQINLTTNPKSYDSCYSGGDRFAFGYSTSGNNRAVIRQENTNKMYVWAQAPLLSGSAIVDGVTATTQASGDNSTKLATTAYVDGGLSGKSGATNWLNGSADGSVRTSGSAAEDSNYAIGDYATAEGYETKASGDYSHAEGFRTTASGNYSHSEGYYTTAQRESQTVIGEYNVLDTTGSTTTRGDYAFIVGNGTSSARSNAYALEWDGDSTQAGRATTADMSSADIADFITGLGGLGTLIFNAVYPVGSYYETSDSTFDPNVSFGGTWTKVSDGYFLQATTDSSKIGTTVAAGLPNITGEFSSMTYGEGNFVNGASGAFYAGANYQYKGGSTAYWSSNSRGPKFDASRSNSIYGNSTTVQPPAILVYIWHRTA